MSKRQARAVAGPPDRSRTIHVWLTEVEARASAGAIEDRLEVLRAYPASNESLAAAELLSKVLERLYDGLGLD